jgi:hypothetical protein
VSTRPRHALLLLSVSLLACDEEDAPTMAWVGFDAGSGTPMRDASTPLDASRHEPEVADAAMALDPGAECAGDVHTFHAARVEGRAFSTALSGNRLYLAHLVPTCGGSLGQSSAQGLVLVSMLSNGVAEAPRPLIHAGATDCLVTRTPALAVDKAGALSVFYAANGSASAGQQLFVQDGKDAAAKPVQLTMEDATPVEDLVVRIDNTQVVESLHARGGAIRATRVGEAPRELVGAGAGYRITQLAASGIGTASTDLLAAAAWVSASVSAPGSFLQLYDERGPRAQPVLLSPTLRSESSVALATQHTRGAVVYSDESGSLFLRTLERDQTLGEPVRLTSNNQSVGDVAIVRYGIGYAVAFRSTALGSRQTVVRLLVSDELGNQARPRFIALARPDGKGLELRLANDGRLILSWVDPSTVEDPATGRDQLESTVKVARLTCL